MIGDMLDEVVGGLRLAGPRPDQRGGEHDWLRTMAPRTLRRLRGSGWLVAWDNPHGAAPDVLWKTVAENEGAYFGSVDSFVRWYTFTALAALDESRADKNRRRHARLAETRDGRCPHAALEISLQARDERVGRLMTRHPTTEQHLRHWRETFPADPGSPS